MPGKEIKGRSKRANYAHGGSSSMGRILRQLPKAINRLGKKVPTKAGERSIKRLPQKPAETREPKSKMKKGGRAGFPDHSGDGKITQKDILMAKGVIPKTKGKK